MCLLLVGLLLYNPYLTVLSASTLPNVQRPLSFRATIASSELSGATVREAVREVVIAELAICEKLDASPVTFAAFLRRTDKPVHVKMPLRVHSLWFRPPPIL